jgi:hypothetical protein
MTSRVVRSIVAAAAIVAILAAPLPARAQAAIAETDRSAMDEIERHFYNGRYEAAVSRALPRCTAPPLDLYACELATAALHFQIRRAMGLPATPKPWASCSECPALLTTFLAITARAQAAAAEAIKARPTDDATLFVLGKLNLNFVWLQLGTLGKKTGWKEYWAARRSLDDLVKRRPDMVRARVARAWIDYIVDTRVPRGVRWVLGGGDKKKGLRVVREAANTPAEFFVTAEATFALWDMQVRERQMADAVETARRLARDFPENEEVAKFIATHHAAAVRR